MAAANRKRMTWLTTVLLASSALFAQPFSTSGALAQTNVGNFQSLPEDAKLLLAANELVYNKDAETVVARGGVQIDYGGYKMVAKRVEYNQKSGRLMAQGDIELIDPSGTRLYADNLDVTDNFAEGFLNALRIETTDNTRLAAESAERLPGDRMVLNNSVYTACLPCAERPDKAPLWQIKAQKIIQNGQTKTIRLEKAQFELFGRPIAYLPFIVVPDQTVKRKSGFLFPTFNYSQKLGFGVGVPYYFALSPTMDATVTGTAYTNQGFLLEGEFRQQFHNGLHTLRFAGISQMNPQSFSANTTDAMERERGMVASVGNFRINPRWTFGWNVLAQTDNNFSKTYDLSSFDGTTYVNQAYLSGLGRRNAFDLRAFYFDIQDADPNDVAERRQPIAQVLDYNYIAPEPFYGGELSVDVNLTNLRRGNEDSYTSGDVNRFRGLDGTYSRLTAEAEWKRTFITNGLALTPLLAARGDGYRVNMSDPTDNNGLSYSSNFSDAGTNARGMITAGIEARYPIQMIAANSSHIFEPIGQLFVRPDETLAGSLPNEDAQSLVYDATTLFERDKFSGYDRIEGGTRANIGFRYTGSFNNGYALRSVAGQSFHLAGRNSFAVDDLAKVGADSGLEGTRSDYVGLLGVDTPFGVSATLGGRLDEQDLDLKRSDASIAYTTTKFQTALTYTRIAAQPTYGSQSDADEIKSASTIKFRDYWSVFGSVTYDLNNNNISKNALGFSYDDECTIFSLVYEQTRDPDNALANDWKIGARLTFRTLGDINVGNATFSGLN
ncbi:LPS-assembly protein LptD [Rhizobium sp. CFBP 8762]|uniref:LPS-assembly protein LptD n=1 Tax=Rhizobium sp. CFBP 8762 TaxID=2775279 RepID=UPI00313B0A9C